MHNILSADKIRALQTVEGDKRVYNKHKDIINSIYKEIENTARTTSTQSVTLEFVVNRKNMNDYVEIFDFFRKKGYYVNYDYDRLSSELYYGNNDNLIIRVDFSWE